MSFALELSRAWESPIARHRDRYRFFGVDPHDSDLPTPIAAKVGSGETARWDDFACTVLGRDETEPAGHISLVFTLKRGAEKQADLAPLALPAA